MCQYVNVKLIYFRLCCTRQMFNFKNWWLCRWLEFHEHHFTIYSFSGRDNHSLLIIWTLRAFPFARVCPKLKYIWASVMNSMDCEKRDMKLGKEHIMKDIGKIYGGKWKWGINMLVYMCEPLKCKEKCKLLKKFNLRLR